MNYKKLVKGILLDYGGTLDTGGRHWANVLYDLYLKQEVSISKEDFYAAYVYGEKTLAVNRLIKPDFNFQAVLETKLNLHVDFLKARGVKIPKELVDIIALEGYLLVDANMESVKAMLNEHYSYVPLVMVSNFYGNLKAVLKDFGIDHYFHAIVESAIVGYRKPEPAIFIEALSRIGLDAHSTVMIGDSYKKDIAPAKSCGCQTIWLQGGTWELEVSEEHAYEADHIVHNFIGLERILDQIVDVEI